MDEDGKKRFKGICPICGSELWICKSIMMTCFGVNTGHGSCFNCNTFLHLEFNEEKQIFDVETWEDYKKQLQRNNLKRQQ